MIDEHMTQVKPMRVLSGTVNETMMIEGVWVYFVIVKFSGI